MFAATPSSMAPASFPRSRGYVLLAVLLILAALVLLVALSQQRARDEWVTSSFERSHSQARALAQDGLERSRAYLGALLEREPDLDRALDPNLDTDCALLPALGGGTSDDSLPPFSDGTAVVAPSSRKPFLRVPSRDGAYFIRFDDNDDDAQDSPTLASATSNNPSGNCLEGPALGLVRNNPVRDRDAMLWVTVIGVHPGTSLESPAARYTLRALVGPGEAAGIISGGTVNMVGAAHVCGPFGDVAATGSIQGGCLCGAACSSGPLSNSCGSGHSCVGLSAGSTCSASSGGAGGECLAGTPVEPPPRVFPWDVTLAPLGCQGSACTPFYYLRFDSDAAQVRLHAWNYAACSFPRAGARLCGPADCAACWVLLDASPSPLDVHLSDADPGLSRPMPSLTVLPVDAPRIWRADGVTGFSSGPPGCATQDSRPYPETPGFRRQDSPNVTFEFMANPAAPLFARLPRGFWFVEGNVLFRSFNTPGCTTLGADPAYRVSLIATGSVRHEAGALSFPPASPKGLAILAGRDLRLRGNARLFTCGVNAAVAAHEQIELVGNALIEAQLVAENASSCSSQVEGDAVLMQGAATVSVPLLPPLHLGPPAQVRLFSESTY